MTPKKHLVRRALAALVASAALLSIGGSAYAGPSRSPLATTITEANRAFAEGRFAESAAGFEALVKERGPSAALLFDLGNAYLRDGKPALATLEYERAALLAPRDPGIAENLTVARAATGAEDGRGAVRRAVALLPMNTWTELAAAALGFAALAFGLATLGRKRREAWFTAGVSAALVGALSAGALVALSPVLDEGVVLAPSPVRVSPFATAQSSFAFAAGGTVELGPRDGDYVLARDDRGKSGWVERSQVESIIPPS